LNILFVDQFSEVGGGQLCLLDVLDEVRNLGWRATLVVPGTGPMVAMSRARGIDVVAVPAGSSGSTGVNAARYVQQLAVQKQTICEVLGSQPFDVVYVNGPRMLPAIAGLKARPPVIFHAHNRPVSVLARTVACRAIRSTQAAVIACCRFIADVYSRCTSRDRLHVVYNGVAEIPFRERRFSGRLRIGMIGRVEPEKGQLTFVDAARALLEAGADCEFVMCGDPGPSATRYAARVRAAAEGLPVEHVPWQTGIAGLLDTLDMVVLPSSNEGLPRVVLEAFSAGVPVISFPTGGIPEIVEDGVSGYLVHERSARGLATRLLEIFGERRSGLAAIAATARARWESGHDALQYRRAVTDIIARVATGTGLEAQTERQLTRKAWMR
jgi:glycosyltransferase involved in cell wall biosynthesis